MIRRRSKLLRLLALMSLMLLFPLTAAAHERREVGKYDVIVGWSMEPAYTDLMNGLYLRVEDRETKELITGLEKTIKAEVIFGTQKRALEISPTSSSTPGIYSSRLIATQKGDYKFRIFGAVIGQQIDQTFDSADGKFDSMDALEELHFPQADAASAQAQTPAAQAALQRAQAAEAAAASSQTMATAALAVGGLGVLLGIVGMLSAGRRTQA